MEQSNLIKLTIADLNVDNIKKLDFPSEKVTKRAKLDVGLKCNAKCYFCYYREHLDDPFKSFEELKKEILLFKEAGFERIELSGGEPSIHPQFIELLEFIRDNNMKSSFLTNGIAIDQELMKKISNAGTDDILFSIHGTKATHDKTVVHDGAYDHLIELIDWCISLNINPRVNTVVTDNFRELERLWRTFNGKVSEWNLLPLNYWDDANILKRQGYLDAGMYFNRLLRNRRETDTKINIRYFPKCFIETQYRNNVINYYEHYFDKSDWHPFFMDSHDISKEKLQAFKENDQEYYRKNLIQKRELFFEKDKNCLTCELFDTCDGYKK